MLVKSRKETRKWMLRLTVAGKRREMGLGRWPNVPLSEARERPSDARRQLRSGVDPIQPGKWQYVTNSGGPLGTRLSRPCRSNGGVEERRERRLAALSPFGTCHPQDRNDGGRGCRSACALKDARINRCGFCGPRPVTAQWGGAVVRCSFGSSSAHQRPTRHRQYFVVV